jgi:hypothetical protein
MIAAQNSPSQTFPGIQLEQKQNGTKAGHTERYTKAGHTERYTKAGHTERYIKAGHTERYTKAGHTERYQWLATRQVAAVTSLSNGTVNLYVAQVQAYRGSSKRVNKANLL